MMLDTRSSLNIEYPLSGIEYSGWILVEKRELMPIGTAAKKAGVSRQTLQYYLMVGLLEPTEVTPTGRRLFDQRIIDRIKLIKKLNDSGYPLRAIRELFLQGRADTTLRSP